MNIVLHEWKLNFKAFCFWSLGMFFLVAASAAKTSGMAGDSSGGLQEMLEQLPKSIQTVFGVGTVDYSTSIGIFAIVLLYIALIAAFHASWLGVSAFAREERDKTFEFLYVKGRKRSVILTAKLSAGIAEMLLFNLLTYLFSVAAANGLLHSDISAQFFPMMAGVFFIQLTFYSAGMLLSLCTRRMKLASTLSSALVMVCFLFSIFSEFGGNAEFLRYLSPFKYFDGKELIHASLNMGSVFICLAVFLLCTTISYRLHRKRDLHC